MKRSQRHWLQRRWLDLRSGHSLYLALALSFGNFVLITHRLLIERVPFLEQIFPSLWMFALTFFLAYSFTAIIVGYWHRTQQLSVEQDLLFQQFPIVAKLNRIILESISGEARKEEVEQMKTMLRRIEARAAK